MMKPTFESAAPLVSYPNQSCWTPGTASDSESGTPALRIPPPDCAASVYNILKIFHSLFHQQ